MFSTTERGLITKHPIHQSLMNENYEDDMYTLRQGCRSGSSKRFTIMNERRVYIRLEQYVG